MFFNAKQHAFLISVFGDSMPRIDSDSRLQKAVADSIASRQFIAEGTSIPLPQPPYAESSPVPAELRNLQADIPIITLFVD